MTALLLAALLAALPSPPTGWSRSQLEARFGPPTFAGPLEEPWPAGSVMASYSQPVEDTDGLCRVHLGTVRVVRWIALVYYAPAGELVSVHCMRLDDLDTGFDVTPDVLRRLMTPRS